MIFYGRVNQSPRRAHPYYWSSSWRKKRRLIDSLMDWASKLESADLEGHKKFLENAGLPPEIALWKQLLGRMALFLKL